MTFSSSRKRSASFAIQWMVNMQTPGQRLRIGHRRDAAYLPVPRIVMRHVPDDSGLMHHCCIKRMTMNQPFVWQVTGQGVSTIILHFCIGKGEEITQHIDSITYQINRDYIQLYENITIIWITSGSRWMKTKTSSPGSSFKASSKTTTR
jgi:hypothetical protein